MGLLARGAKGIVVVVAVAGCAGKSSGIGGRLLEKEARAEDEKPKVFVSPLNCAVKGSWPIPKGTQLFDAPRAGRALAVFTGAFSPVTLGDFPTDLANGRARVRTSADGPALRIDGYVSPMVVPLFTARDLTVASGHVWISSAQQVKLVQAANSALTIELSILGTSNQTVQATAPCDAFSLERKTQAPTEVPSTGRGYLMKGSTLVLYDEPNGKAVFTLKMVQGGSQLFWGTESRAGFVHVQARADLTIDAWARQKELDPIKKGEMRDQLIPPTSVVQGAKLVFDKPPHVFKATRDIPVRARREEKDKPIGVIETGAEVYMLETVAGWANIVPKHLGFTPPDDAGFWIPASAVGL